MYINQFIEQGYSVNITLTSQILKHDSIIENIDDSFILINTISNIKYNISDIDHIVLFTNSSLWYIKNKLIENKTINTSAVHNNNDDISDLESLNYIQNFITPYKN